MVRSESGWTRNDRDVERRVINYLSRQHFPGLRSVEVEAAQGVVTIRGRVKSFHERQLCINCCQRVAGVVHLNDEIQVEDWGRPTMAACESRFPALALTGA
jgi:osmotically-inducible protein OsmY